MNEQGALLDAEFDLETTPTGVEIVLHSRQGSANTTAHRNVDYFAALEAILERLASVDGKILCVAVDSVVARRLPAEDRVIPLDYPIVLSTAPDIGSVRRRITEEQRKVAWTGGAATHRGNNHKRIRIAVDLVTAPVDLQTLLKVLRVVGIPTATGLQQYREASPSPAVRAADLFTFDPAARERALAAHARTQNALAAHVRSRGWTPLSPGSENPDFDLAWWVGSTMYVAEVKSLSGLNPTYQLRLGLGQVLHYRSQLMGAAEAPVAVLAVEREPEPTWLAVCKDAGVLLTWPPTWPGIDVTLTGRCVHRAT